MSPGNDGVRSVLKAQSDQGVSVNSAAGGIIRC